jgi:hypothetical protein
MNQRRYTDRDVLAYDPFDMGKGDDDAKTLRNEFVVTRVPSVCSICMDDIPAGTRARALTQQSAQMRKVMTFKFCAACADAMGRAVALDDFAPMERRYEIGRVSSQRSRNDDEG